MDADLDTLCTAVYVTADDLLPARAANARRGLNDAEVVTLAVAQVVMGIPSDRRFLAVARRRLRHLFPSCPPSRPTSSAAGALPRRSTGWPASSRPAARASTTTWCCSTPPRSSAAAPRTPPVARPWPTGPATAGAAATRASSGGCGCTCAARSMAPRVAPSCAGADQREREVALELLATCAARRRDRGLRQGLCRARLRARRRRLGRARGAAPPSRRARGSRPHLGRIRQRIESVFQTFKDILSLERHGARTPAGLRTRVGVRILALAASVWLNHQLGRPSRSLVAYVA